MAYHHFLITDPEREQVQTLCTEELDEFYTAAELDQMREGQALFKNGALHVDMLAAARAVTMAELEG